MRSNVYRKNRHVIIMKKNCAIKCLFPPLVKLFSQHFMPLLYIAHIFINISYLFDCIFYFRILNCFDVLGALLSVWDFCSKFSILLRVGEVWFAPKQVYIYILVKVQCWEEQDLLEDITHCTVHLSNIPCSLHQTKPLWL